MFTTVLLRVAGIGFLAFIVIAAFIIWRFWKPFINRIAPPIIIEVSPESFVFRSKDNRLELKPQMYLDKEWKQTFGIEQKPQDADENIIKVELFNCNDYLEKNVRINLLLQHFIRYGMTKVGNQWHMFLYVLLRQTVTLRGMETFAKLFYGYQYHIFDSVLTDIGLKVRYE